MDKIVVTSVIAVAVALIAAFTDFRERRIPNKLTYPATMLALFVQTLLWGWKGLLSGLVGGLLFGGIFLLFYIVRAMGGGDVKLATALGCFAGGLASMKLMFAVAVAGGILAIIYTLRAKRFMITLRNTLDVIRFHSIFGLQSHPTVNLANTESVRMPYGLAFAAGAVYWSLSVSVWR